MNTGNLFVVDAGGGVVYRIMGDPRVNVGHQGGGACRYLR
jgi:hypothetical protein